MENSGGKVDQDNQEDSLLDDAKVKRFFTLFRKNPMNKVQMEVINGLKQSLGISTDDAFVN